MEDIEKTIVFIQKLLADAGERVCNAGRNRTGIAHLHRPMFAILAAQFSNAGIPQILNEPGL
jgi:hypothetical protein